VTATPTRYTRLQSLLHWAIAALVLFQIVFHESIGTAWHATHDGVVPTSQVALWANFHVFAGLAIFVLAVLLVIQRIRNGGPPPPADEPAFLRLVALGTKVALYALVLIMPISGSAAWFFDVQTAGFVHGMAELPAILLVLLHFSGAMYQAFVLRSDVLRRMLPLG
jgi:cytochrome b561